MNDTLRARLMLPGMVTAAGVVIHLMNHAAVRRMLKTGPWTEIMNYQLISQQIVLSIALVAAIGVFYVRIRGRRADILFGCGVLAGWSVLALALQAAVPGAALLHTVVGLPVHLFGFIGELTKLYAPGMGALAAVLRVAAPFVLALFLLGRKQTPET